MLVENIHYVVVLYRCVVTLVTYVNVAVSYR